MKKPLYVALILVLLVVFGVSAFFVGRYVLDSYNQDKLSDKLDEIKAEATAPQVTETKPVATVPATTEQTQEATEATVSPTTLDGILTEYAGVYEYNKDMVGWIKIEGTAIDYPVVQTPDNPDYYLHRAFDGSINQNGAIYVREQCDVNRPSDNVTIYGHNMASGKMFAALHKYESKEFWEDNRLIIFDTLTERHVYEIFAVFKTLANVGEGFSYHQFVDAADEKEFDDFVATCKKLGNQYYYDTGITPVYGDKLICLSTCEYSLGDNGRLVVAAVRIS